MRDFNVILFDGFETLDAFGPVEIAGKRPEIYRLEYFSISGGLVTSAQNIQINTRPFSEITSGGILLVPGGQGTRRLVDDTNFISALTDSVKSARYILSVCTGAALLARTGVLDGRAATTNKRAFDWASGQGVAVNWQKRARWVVDGNIYTSSGISAGMDMTLGFIADTQTCELAVEIAQQIEYIWNSNKKDDPFALE